MGKSAPIRLLPALILLIPLLSSCCSRPFPARPGTEDACSKMIVERIYFGMNFPGGVVSEREWRKFLEQSVTPGFPGGLTVIEAQGQWLGKDLSIAKEPSRILELVLPAAPGPAAAAEIQIDPADREKINRIIAEYKTRFRQEAVLTVTTAAAVCFY